MIYNYLGAMKTATDLADSGFENTKSILCIIKNRKSEIKQQEGPVRKRPGYPEGEQGHWVN